MLARTLTFAVLCAALTACEQVPASPEPRAGESPTTLTLRVPAAHSRIEGESCVAEIRTVPYGPLSEVLVYRDEDTSVPALSASTLGTGTPDPDGVCVFTAQVTLDGSVPPEHYRVDVLSETHSLILTWRVPVSTMHGGSAVNLPLSAEVLNY